MTEADGKKILDEKIAAYVEERKTFARGFARFVIKQGRGAIVPSSEDHPDPNHKPVTWLRKGRELYGKELFDQVMHEEIAARDAQRVA